MWSTLWSAILELWPYVVCRRRGRGGGVVCVAAGSGTTPEPRRATPLHTWHASDCYMCALPYLPIKHDAVLLYSACVCNVCLFVYCLSCRRQTPKQLPVRNRRRKRQRRPVPPKSWCKMLRRKLIQSPTARALSFTWEKRRLLAFCYGMSLTGCPWQDRYVNVDVCSHLRVQLSYYTHSCNAMLYGVVLIPYGLSRLSTFRQQVIFGTGSIKGNIGVGFGFNFSVVI